MGEKMALNLLKNGCDLTVYNRTAEKANGLISKGAKKADSLKDAAAGADLVITMVSTPEAVESIAAGADGFVSAMKKGAVWCDCSTVNPSFTLKMAEMCDTAGIRFVDAPVAGSKMPAEKGELVFLAGGAEADIRQIENVLLFMGKKVIKAGSNGKGSALKLVINSMLAHAMIAFSEALFLGEALGLPKELLLNELPMLPVAAPITGVKAKKIAVNDFSPDFPLEWMQKDMYLATLTAYENNISIPAANNAKEIFAMAKSLGLGREDISAVYKLLKSLKK